MGAVGTGQAEEMTEAEIVAFVIALEGVDLVVASEENGAPEVAWGDSFFFYDPAGDTPADRRLPFATIVTGDYPGFDEASQLDRPGVFRLNVSVGKDTFTGLFDPADTHDPAALDTPLPHPVYGPQGWISILNPGPTTSDLARTLLSESYARARTRFERRSR
jgi:hypothetical protein